MKGLIWDGCLHFHTCWLLLCPIFSLVIILGYSLSLVIYIYAYVCIGVCMHVSVLFAINIFQMNSCIGILVTLVWLLRKLRKREEDIILNLLLYIVLISKNNKFYSTWVIVVGSAKYRLLFYGLKNNKKSNPQNFELLYFVQFDGSSENLI